MTEPMVAPYGAWKSPLTADVLLASALGLSELQLDGETIYWTELRPSQGGRTVLVRRTPDGQISDVTPAPFHARTRVHEYGGGSYLAAGGAVYFSNFADQRLYRVRDGGAPEPLTPDLPDGVLRYADATLDATRNRLILVREDHRESGQEAKNTLVALTLDGENADGGHVLVDGTDFVSTPRLNPDGSRLTWLAWNHPNMPWDGTALWVAEIAADGSLANAQQIAGGQNESVFQPTWSPDGELYFISDRTGWWNLYRWRNGQAEALASMEAEFGLPQWQFRMATYDFSDAGHIICAWQQDGLIHLGSLDLATGALTPIETSYTLIAQPKASASQIIFVGASPTQAGQIVRMDTATGQQETLRQSSTLTLDDAWISVGKQIAFPTENGLTSYGFYYPPRNPDFVAPEGELPPLRVLSHGGPTSQVFNGFNPSILYWTSRGFAVLDVNYGGSTGYGRAYRDRLKGQWGVVDLDDCVNGARYLAQQGPVDGNRVTISGGSAGGYTTLCGVTFRDAFRAGASHFGVSDLGALARDTHKFESRYLDQMVGPYPEREDLYQARSPIFHVDQLHTPVIFFQGLEDPVVPPNQAETMVEALRAKGVPVAYLAFEGESHGFRQAANIKRSLEAELYFFGRILGYTPADEIEPVQIDNLPE
ncbi:MAG TPA: S9 family peptidase [Ktedonobacterales bacterium]|nr:S9 family peptidase [Ktedonobacterales bacterium]